jgi:Domain of unknown function (DUF4189)
MKTMLALAGLLLLPLVFAARPAAETKSYSAYSPVAKDCAALLIGDVGMVSSVGYGVGYNYETEDQAVQRAHEEMDRKGIVYDDPHKYSSTEFKGCGVAHGAVAGVRNPAKPEVIISLTVKFGSGDSPSDAEQMAIEKCEAHPNAKGKTCEVLESW